MKKLLLILFALIIAVPGYCDHSGVSFSGVSTADPTPDCPSGTYYRSINFDHSTSTVTGCNDSGGGTDTWSQTGGTIGATGATSNGFRITAEDQRVELTGGTFNESTGTVWMHVKVADANGDRSADALIYEFTASASPTADYIYLRIQASAEVVRAYWEGNNSATNITSTNTFTPGSYFWLGYSWSTPGTDKHSIYVASGWEEETEALNSHSNAPDEERLGDLDNGGAHTETIDIDDYFYISGTYQAANPGL